MTQRRNLLLAALAAAALQRNAAAQGGPPLRVGIDATFPPMEFVADGKRTGFDIELVESVARLLGRPPEWVDIDFKGLIPGLIARRFDMAVSAIYITDERRKVVDFSDPYYTGGLVVLVQQGNQAIHTLADLDGKRVSVQVGTKSVGYLAQQHPRVQRVEVEKNQEMFNLVEIGRADAAVTGKPAALQYLRTRPGLRLLAEQLTSEEYGMALRKDQPQLTQAVNAALARLRADGSHAALVGKWFGGGAAK